MRRVLSREIVKVPRALTRRAGTRVARAQYALRPSRSPEEVVRRRWAAPTDISVALAAFRTRETPRFFFSRSETSKIAGTLEQNIPNWRERVVADADRVCAHVVRLLGADAVDLDAYAAQAGRENQGLPWHEDVLNAYSWPARAFYKQVPIPYDRADMKVPWELARSQHLATAGIAFRVTGDERYAREVVAQIDDFIRSNAPGYGINWVSTMDVAIRAANWLCAYELIADSQAASDGFLTRLLASLIAHGRHIEENISIYEGGVTTNHTVADYAGLVCLGVMLPELVDAPRWREVGISGLSDCMRRHVSPDGVDYENSMAYHRLVTEMYLGALMLTERNGYHFPADYRASLERMLDFVLHYMPPTGQAPLVGDSDDGRWHVLGDYFAWDPRDHRHLLAVGAAVYDRPDFAAAASGSSAAVQEAAWLAGPDAAATVASRTRKYIPPGSRAFPRGGRYVMAHGSHHAVVSTDEVGTAGFGNHKHNDILSFELVVDGQPTVVDCGTYLYLRDREARDSFRATRSHNTVVLDGLEQNDMTDTFRMRPRARVTVHAWETTPEVDLLDASHTGYEEAAGVRHRRRIGFRKGQFAWLVVDSLDGRDEHAAASFLHLAPGMRVAQDSDQGRTRSGEFEQAIAHLAPRLGIDQSLVPVPEDALACRAATGAGVLVVPLNCRPTIERGWVSPRYGRRTAAEVVRLHSAISASSAFGYLLLQTPEVSA